MYVPNNLITFTITRSKQETPKTPGQVIVITPENDVSSASITNVVQPSKTAEGSVTFNYTPNTVGLYRFEIYATTSGINELMHTILIGVVSEDVVYISSMSN